MTAPTEVTYTVPDISCAHCEQALSEALVTVPGVREVSVDLENKHVVVRGDDVPDAAARAAMSNAGYEAA